MVSCALGPKRSAETASTEVDDTDTSTVVRALPDDGDADARSVEGTREPLIRGCDGKPLREGDAPPLIQGPRLVHAAPFIVSREAFAAGVHGTARFKCTIEVDGTASDCSMVKSLPYLDESILAWARASKYSPAIRCGHPQRVEVTTPFRTTVPRPVLPHRD
jgi:TonB family protein